MRYLALITLIILTSRVAHAQQDPLYAQYINAPILINPAFAGFNHDLNFTAVYRKQWAGFEGSPQTTNITGQIALAKNKMGAGVTAMDDRVGANRTSEVQAFYAYHLPISSNTKLSFGLMFGAIQYKTDYSDLTINPNDPKFASLSTRRANFGSGIMLSGDKYIFGVSLPKMLSADNEGPAAGLYNRHIYVMGAYMFHVSARVKIKPYAMYRSAANSQSSFDIGGTIHGDDSYSLGAFTRNFNTYGFSAQIKLGDLIRMAYVFELPTNDSAGLRYTSHEVMLCLRVKALSFHDVAAVTNF